MPAPEDPNLERRRASRRLPVLKSGRMFLSGGGVVSCVILNISDGGAKIRLLDRLNSPDEFDLEIGSDAPRPCRVVWRSVDTVGVKFVAKPITSADADPKKRRARKR